MIGPINVVALFISSSGSSFILTYTGSTGGIVSGSLLQVVASGANGTAVTAIPDS